jgi:4-alpha-glucanotransferase
MRFQFYVRFHTRHGQSLWITGNIEELGNYDPDNAVLMDYLNYDYWHVTIAVKRKELPKNFSYTYFLKNDDQEIILEGSNDKIIELESTDLKEIHLIDYWNHAGEFENTFYTSPFKKVLLNYERPDVKPGGSKNITHIFKVKAPLLKKDETLCLLGTAAGLSAWDTSNPVMMKKEGDWWLAKMDLSGEQFPIPYKYAVYNYKTESFVQYENGNNRLLYSDADKKKLSILHDGFVQLPNNTWKGAGVAIPVFSLRSRNGFGVGEFADIKKMVDWAQLVGLKLIQLLPINDTTATHTWKDSYPYAAISAFALHPIYINLETVAEKYKIDLPGNIKKKQKELNKLPVVDYEEVMNVKISVLKNIYEEAGYKCLDTPDFNHFFHDNRHWLQPYAAFCFFRDRNGTAHYDKWESNSIYQKEDIEELFSGKSTDNKEPGFFYFLQYQLHLQLKDAVEYARKKGVILKGDIPIGIYRYGCDAWVAPDLYNMCWQAGAPPDDFTATGQNWGFPTYNWKRMQEDGFRWWKQRFEQMSNYFDAFRIDHILGFFRIWSIPINSLQGLMGRFVPCLPVHIDEFGEKGVWFDYQRYCRPYITDEVLQEIFNGSEDIVKQKFLIKNNVSGYDLKLEFNNQVKIEKYFNTLEPSQENKTLKAGLFDLISNVILLEDTQSPGEEFHFRISMDKTLSFKFLIPHVQEKLKELYVNYFFRRQDDFWYKEAMHKLPQLKAATNMLVCGEDLGMVPHCVPEVMQALGILSLEIQRMPKDPKKEFFHPHDAPYLSVITPSTHDMSTIRGWWEENRERTQKFYNDVLGQWGDAPFYCESWINRAIVMQHLYSPAMWSIFQLQDLLGMSESLRRDKPQEERINDPANPDNYWQYRMHLTLEDLFKESAFNDELKDYLINSDRI